MADQRKALSTRATSTLVIAALPAALLVAAAGFATGGYFPATAGIVALLLAGCLVCWFAFARRPAAHYSRRFAVAAVAMALYCGWVLASTLWSDSPVRGVVDFDRDLLYLFALLLGAILAPSADRMRWVMRAVALGGFAVCVAGLASRTLPDLFSTTPGMDDTRLSFPLTYWNALGFLAGLTLILCASIAADRRGALAGRALAAAATPILAATLVLTLGRGPVLATVAGLAVLVVVGFGPGILSAIVAIGPACGVAVVAALDADLLVTAESRTQAAIAQGHHLALVVALAGAGAAALMVLLRPVDRRLPSRLNPAVAWGGATVAVFAIVVAALVGGVPAKLDQAVDELSAPPGRDRSELPRDRLTHFSSQVRIDHWDVALAEFERHPLAGSGAATFQTAWNEHRPVKTDVRDAHSLYLENLAELGIVGVVLLLVVLGTIGFGFARRARGSERALFAGFLAAYVAWLLEAGLDWLWEMPALTAWLFFAGGAALAGTAPARAAGRWRVIPRVVAVAGLLALCLLPARLTISQLRLNQGLAAFERDDCPAAVDASLSSLSAFGDRPEPYVLLGYCDVSSGAPHLGVTMMRRAVSLDRENWEYHYGYSLALAAAGVDPRSQARRTRELNPLEPATEAAVAAFAGDDPATWRRNADRLPRPMVWGRPLG